MTESESVRPQGVLAFTPFFLYPDHQQLWNRRFDPIGGMHLLGRSIVLEMARLGYPQRVLTMAPPGVPKDLRIAPDVMVHARRLPVLPIPSKLEGYFGLVGAWAKASLLYVLAHREQLRQEVGLVHAHCDGSGSAPAYAYAASRILGVPILSQVYSCRSLTQQPTTLFERVSDPVAKAAERTVIQRSQAVLTLTDEVRERVRDELGVPDERVHRFAYLSDDKFADHDSPEKRAELRRRFGIRDDLPVVMYVGRIAIEKGVDYFIRAVALLNQRRRCQFVVVGDGPQREEIERLARELGLSDNLVVTGFVAHDTLASMIGLGSVIVLPSRYEELGIVVLESMLMGKPVVAHDVNGIHNLIDHMETGLLVPPFDSPKLAEAVETILDDPALGQRLAAAAINVPRYGYSLASASSRLERIYQDLLKEAS